MKKWAISIGIAVAVMAVFCMAVNEQWKRDCKETKYMVDMMHRIVGC